MYFCYFVLISPGISGALYLNKLESPPTKHALCQVWLKLLHWFWRRRLVFKFRSCTFAISLLSPFEKGGALQLNKFEFPLCFVPSWSEMLTLAFSSVELKCFFLYANIITYMIFFLSSFCAYSSFCIS